MFDIIISPLEAIASAKSEESIGKTLLVLFVASLLGAISSLIISKSVSGPPLIFAAVILVGGFIGVLFLSLLLRIVLYLLTQRGGYFEALTVLAYPFLIGAVASFVASILGLVPSIGFVLSALVIVFGFVVASAVLLRTTVELFQVDLITSIVALALVYISLTFVIYSLVTQFLSMLLTGVPAVGPVSIPIGIPTGIV